MSSDALVGRQRDILAPDQHIAAFLQATELTQSSRKCRLAGVVLRAVHRAEHRTRRVRPVAQGPDYRSRNMECRRPVAASQTTSSFAADR
jgi:hypothetical protein